MLLSFLLALIPTFKSVDCLPTENSTNFEYDSKANERVLDKRDNQVYVDQYGEDNYASGDGAYIDDEIYERK
ncbi:hypothetical protein Bpfe_003503 [Biomphalaria pfeifferi]|uniref:Uncharacterized protein n=1 Tax=Biomphalaria pfeifferi TaxID=112525 RepID=A0AAD8FK10_BIOPF|nr:hypothetical protein Bpfe_003503 [Biomphalaria pfeifferi]